MRSFRFWTVDFRNENTGKELITCAKPHFTPTELTYLRNGYYEDNPTTSTVVLYISVAMGHILGGYSASGFPEKVTI
jgi:hypothetical protein